MHKSLTTVLSQRALAASRSFARVAEFYFTSRYGEKRGDAAIADFTFGNPHEMPLQGLVDGLRKAALPEDKNWFAYKSSEPEPQQFLAEHVGPELGLDFAPEDFALTSGAFAAIMVAFRLLLDAGDEVIYSEPAWFCYEPTLLAADAVPVPVRLREPGFDLDIEAIEAAITPRTRLVVVNSPHNPTGRIYDRATWEALAAMLERASARIGRRIFILSDEPYRRLRFDGRGFVSPAAVYPWTLIDYSYGKVLLAPGQRLGYLAISPLMPETERQALRDAMFPVQMALGWCFPNAIMQHAIADLESLSIDQAALARRRDLLIADLGEAGYDVLEPEGTFYLWARWPGDAEAIWNRLADREVYVMPGSILGGASHFRISLTASDEMVERALGAFKAARG
ncbi:aminotransferase class I/II-fold pyridoxal phosphate-dependent enzyme [Devosia sp. ZB163]|uniref:aminotransferase class I/II-fold pyridoxal phosphate-dependent enzyme n=1 Tax=Devosia sp. ZB163 TaxID=3025938 RepID=UPI002361D095|nr:aminotransferase class I/II-fold pyridoxal phosphate-dependent enzyme [Devosia sp. ZB163]MDC9822246.1 aminotransferase class I/II-fold pyridoxal phosphate-dependent enzyme [Devosia sp. ZB163]